MNKPTIGMGVLSWRGAASLNHALSSYEAADLYSLFDERVIILPEPDNLVRKVAEKHPLKITEFTQNLGISGGMRAVAEALTTDYVLFLENDCPLIETRAEARMQIDLSLTALSTGKAFMSRLRSRRAPGELFNTLAKYQRYWGRNLTSKTLRTLRPQKATRLCGTAVYSLSNPHEVHPKFITKHAEDVYMISSKVMPWTNQSILIKRSDFLDVILPYVEAQPLKRAINGFHNIEIELNRSKFWTQSGFKILCPKGVFTHKRLGDRGYV